MKIFFYTSIFSPQGKLNDINEQNTAFLDCKHKHMMKSGAPLDNVRVLRRLLPIKFQDFISRFDFKGYNSLVPGLISTFLERVWTPLNHVVKNIDCLNGPIPSTLVDVFRMLSKNLWPLQCILLSETRKFIHIHVGVIM